MEEIDTPDDLDFTQQEHLEEKSEKIWISSGLSCLNSEGIVFHPEVEEAEAGRMEGERNYFIKLLEETKKEAVQCGSVRGIYGGEDGVMRDDSTISHDSDSNTLEQKGGGGGGSVTDLALQLKMLPKEEQVKAKLSLMAKQLESLSPGDLKREEFVRFDREGVVRKVEDMIDSVQRQPNDYYAVMYERAGEVVDEEEGKISLTKYEHLLKDEIAYTIHVVLDEHPLNFELQDFQMLALHALGSLHNVVFISPTGSGKMIVDLLAILVLQKILNIPDGVGVGTQPLSSIMEEKIKESYIPTGTISMLGGLKSSSEGGDDEDEDVSLSSPIEDFKNGTIKCLLGHAESWISPVAREILDSLQDKGLIIFNFLDEAHIPLTGHWDNFRPLMKVVPGQLRGRAVRGTPTLAMTATMTKKEIPELQKTFGLRVANTIVLHDNPIQKHHKYIRIQRPANIYGSYGKVIGGVAKPGLLDTLRSIVLDQYIELVRSGNPVKAIMIFLKKEEDLADINDFLCEACPELAADPSTCPWVVNFSGVGPATAKSIRERSGEISLYLTTSVMLMGINLQNIEVVIMVRPFSQLHSLVQACGRGGRKMAEKGRKRVVFYLLWNKSDIADNVDISPAVRELCMTEKCLKEVLMDHFGTEGSMGGDWCCSNCD